jgi:hypothetical protein
MEGLRLVSAAGLNPHVACIRCQATGCPWDRVAGKAICPDCQEAIALGEAEPLVERLERGACCAVCQRAGSVRFLSFPLHHSQALELELCPEHFRGLLGRRLDRKSFRRLRQHLEGLGITVQQVFLLHEAFYDAGGRPLQPVPEA